eukprot:TCONS_00013267-protein
MANCLDTTSMVFLIICLFGNLAHSMPMNEKHHFSSNPLGGQSKQEDECLHTAEIKYFECVRRINDGVITHNGSATRGKMAVGVMAERRIRFASCVNKFQHQNNGCRY